MRKCVYEKDLKFMKKDVMQFFPNSLCFDKDIIMYSNWYDADFKNFFISFDAC